MSEGHSVFRGVLPDALVAALRAEFFQVADRARKTDPASLATDECGKVMSIGGLDRLSELIFDLARHEGLLAIVTFLLGRGVLPFRIEYVAGVSERLAIPAHQDQAVFETHFDDELAVTLWCPLTRPWGAPLEYGTPAPPLVAAPGALLPHRPYPTRVERFSHRLVSDPSTRFQPVDVAPGDILIHHAYAIYRSVADGRNRDQLALTINYRTSPFRQP